MATAVTRTTLGALCVRRKKMTVELAGVAFVVALLLSNLTEE